MEYGTKFRIYPTKEQQKLIEKTFGCCRFVYNHFLAYRRDAYQKDGTKISLADCSRELTRMMNEEEEYGWLREVPRVALNHSIRDLDRAYQNFFHGINTGKKVGYPSFKSKHKSKPSFRVDAHLNKRKDGTIYTTETYMKDDNHIVLPKLGSVKCKGFRPIEGRMLNATVSKTPSDEYMVSVIWTDVDPEILPITHNEIGIDLGIKDLAILSDGTKYPNHKYAYKSEKKLARLQRRLSRKPKGSKNYEKAKKKVAKQYQKIRNQRIDTIHKMTHEIVMNNDLICVETLRPSNMVKNHKLARSIYDASFYEISRQLDYKSQKYGRVFVKIDQWFPSSQLCSNCGYQNPDVKNLDVRIWTCPNCGVTHDRDVNAAKNILKEGKRILTSPTL